jgi:hypothetical protein
MTIQMNDKDAIYAHHDFQKSSLVKQKKVTLITTLVKSVVSKVSDLVYQRLWFWFVLTKRS